MTEVVIQDIQEFLVEVFAPFLPWVMVLVLVAAIVIAALILLMTAIDEIGGM